VFFFNYPRPKKFSYFAFLSFFYPLSIWLLLFEHPNFSSLLFPPQANLVLLFRSPLILFHIIL
jgi:hypothetical protein